MRKWISFLIRGDIFCLFESRPLGNWACERTMGELVLRTQPDHRVNGIYPLLCLSVISGHLLFLISIDRNLSV